MSCYDQGCHNSVEKRPTVELNSIIRFYDAVLLIVIVNRLLRQELEKRPTVEQLIAVSLESMFCMNDQPLINYKMPVMDQ